MVSSISTVSKMPVTNTIIESKRSHSTHLDSNLNTTTKHSIDQVVVGRKQEINDDIINKKLDDINKILEKQQLETSYQRHEQTNRLVIRLVDKETKEVVKEIPPEKLLDYAAGMDEMLGLFLDKRA